MRYFLAVMEICLTPLVHNIEDGRGKSGIPARHENRQGFTNPREKLTFSAVN